MQGKQSAAERSGVDGDAASVLGHYFSSNREAEACAFGAFRREEGIKNADAIGLRHARPIVEYREFHAGGGIVRGLYVNDSTALRRCIGGVC